MNAARVKTQKLFEAKPTRKKAAAAAAPAPATTARPPSREGKRTVVLHLDPEQWRALRLLSIDQRQTMQALGVEALTDLLAKYA